MDVICENKYFFSVFLVGIPLSYSKFFKADVQRGKNYQMKIELFHTILKIL